MGSVSGEALYAKTGATEDLTISNE